jgi:hypothetical protein
VIWLGLAVVILMWIGVIWLLIGMLGFNRLDDDPDERDPYN